MKKIFFLALTIFSFSAIHAQTYNTIQGTDMVWFGLDFSKAKFIGAFENVPMMGTPAPKESMENQLINKFIPAWNNLVVNEADKYDLKKTFKKAKVLYEREVVLERNKKIAEKDLISWNPYVFASPMDTINKVISEYNNPKIQEGLGVVFIVESFNKNEVMANVYVTFFDIKTKKVILSEKVSDVPAGVGVRNYWAGSILRILKQIEGKKMKVWLKK